MGVRIGGVWHEELPDPGTGGTDSGNGRNFNTPGDYNAAAGGTWGPAAPSAGGGGGGVNAASPGQAPGTVNNAGAQQLAAGINSLLGAIASGNQKAFDEAVRQFNETFGLQKDQFNEQIRQFNQNFGVTQAGLTGGYGVPGYAMTGTAQAQAQQANLAAQQAGLTGFYNAPAAGATGNLALDAFQFRASNQDKQIYLDAEGGDPLKAAEHYFRDVTGAVQNAVQQAGGQWNPSAMSQWVYGPQTPQMTQSMQAQEANLYGYVPQNINAQGIAVGASGQPLTTLAAQQQAYAQQMGAIQAAAALQANPFRQQQVIGQLGPLLSGIGGVAGFQAPNTVAGVGTQGGNTQGGLGYMQQIIDDIKSPGANQASMQGVLNAIPTPNKINSADFLRSAPSTQQMVLQGMQEKYGLDPNDSLAQIKNTLPAFQAPTTFGTIKG